MDQSTHDVRRAGWLGIITECQQRPANVSAKQWLADNGINEKAYYYWLHKFRREACGEMQLPAVKTPAEVSFAEINVPVSVPTGLTTAGHAAATIRVGEVTLEVTNDIPEALLKILLQEVVHA